MSKTKTSNRVCELRWDTTDVTNPGWFAQVVDVEWDIVTDDSAKIDFPVDLDVYGPGEGRYCAAALAAALKMPVLIQVHGRTVRVTS